MQGDWTIYEACVSFISAIATAFALKVYVNQMVTRSNRFTGVTGLPSIVTVKDWNICQRTINAKVLISLVFAQLVTFDFNSKSVNLKNKVNIHQTN